MRIGRVIFCLIMLISSPVLAEGTLPKFVSLDHCADQFALALADKSQIVALSKRAREDYAFFAEQAKEFPQTTGSIEEVLYAKPDIAIRYWRGRARMRSILKQAEIQVIAADTGFSADAMLNNMDAFSKAFGHENKGAVIIADYKNRLKNLAATPVQGLRALYLSPNGSTAGKGTFANEMLKLTGLTNIAAEMDFEGWRMIPLENLILDPPDVIIGAFFDSASIQRSDWGIIRHPAVQRMFENIPTIFVPGRLLSCRTFTFVDAAEFILDRLGAIKGQL
ncbi:MAG: ABC transporter substrate-binding protein [Rhodospirillales bacterium]|nr:ABC transporter substrate-binding protein [Rhodospirillales bacterium]